MDFVKAQYERIRQQLSGLSASQKMLTVTLLAIMAITLMYWVKYAGKPEMEPLLDQSMSAGDIERIRGRLAGMGIPSEVSGDRVLVPAEQKLGVLTSLTYEQALPSNTSDGWDAIIKNVSPWGSDTQNAAWWSQAKQAKLAEVIKGWPGVQDANVLIDATERRSFTNPTMPSATISIKMRDGKRPDKKLVMAAADLVAGAQANLDRNRITVVVNGASYPMHDQGSDSVAAGSDLLEVQQGWEEHYAQKITNQLSWLPAQVFVSVSVAVNNKATQLEQTTYDPKGTAKVETKIRSKTTEENSNQRNGADVGMGANTQANLGDAGTGTQTTNNGNEDETEFESGLSSTHTVSKEAPGSATVVAATVRVPRSYFVQLYRQETPGANKDPDEATLQPILERELAKIRNDVKGCVGLKDDAAATVETYADAVLTPAPAAPPGGATNVAAVVGVHGKEIALGALAVVSLFMMSMMVKKGTPVTVAAVQVEAEGPVPQLAAGEQVVGEAGEGEQMLDGMELDEDAAKTQQLQGQVSELVKDNPDAAANLIKRWLNK